MEEIVNSLRTLFATYGFRAGAIVVLTLIVVNLVKKPVVKKAEALSARTGVDKSVITRYVTFLPVLVALVLELAAELITTRFALSSLDLGKLVSSSILYGALATATYESVKKQLEAYAAAYKKRRSTDKEKEGELGFKANGPEQ